MGTTKAELEFTENGQRDLEGLKMDTGCSELKDLFNNALTLFIWAVEQRKLGRQIASMDEKEKRYKIFVLPALERVKPRH